MRKYTRNKLCLSNIYSQKMIWNSAEKNISPPNALLHVVVSSANCPKPLLFAANNSQNTYNRYKKTLPNTSSKQILTLHPPISIQKMLKNKKFFKFFPCSLRHARTVFLLFMARIDSFSTLFNHHSSKCQPQFLTIFHFFYKKISTIFLLANLTNYPNHSESWT